MWWWWRGKLTKTAMEKLKPWDMEELSRREMLARRKCQEELDKVDWESMKKHLHTPAALQAYENICNRVRENISNKVTSVIYQRRPDVRLQFYYGKYAYLPFKERVLLEWADAMKQLQKTYPLRMKLLQKILPVSKKSGVLAAIGLSTGAVCLGGANWFGYLNEQKKEKKETEQGVVAKEQLG